jgi:hypothetical protein
LPIGAIVLSLVMIKSADHQKMGVALVDKVVGALAPITGSVQRLFGLLQRRKAIS